MVRSGLLMTVALAAGVVAAQAQSVRYGSPSGCAGKPTTTEPYLFYDGTKLVTADTTCAISPAGGDKVTAQCDGPRGKTTETYTVVLVPTSAQILRDTGARLLGLPACR